MSGISIARAGGSFHQANYRLLVPPPAAWSWYAACAQLGRDLACRHAGSGQFGEEGPDLVRAIHSGGMVGRGEALSTVKVPRSGVGSVKATALRRL
jgi:hypothetical protein